MDNDYERGRHYEAIREEIEQGPKGVDWQTAAFCVGLAFVVAFVVGLRFGGVI